MKKWIFLCFILLAVLLEASVLNYFKIFYAKPALVFACVVLSALYLDTKYALMLAVFAGILQDTFGIAAYGIHTLLYPACVFLIIKLTSKVSLDNNYLLTGLLVILLIINDISARLILISSGNAVPALGIFLRIAFFRLIYTAAVFPLLLKIAKPITCE